ncbi:hypothetical protein RJT34_32535 [Clitoria ternatea]|uniref:F-box domain-containing protein n=1 Tax=Clitoria ternatea TaxID=43366 RepID=A0AAN9I3W1_CLITE
MVISGEGEFYPRRYFLSNSMDSGCKYSSPTKKARTSAPSRSTERKHEKKYGVEDLPDECLYEIFKQLPDNRARSACACVSKRWLMLLSSISMDEFDRLTSSSDESMSSDEDQLFEGDGYLTRCLEGRKATEVRLAAIAVGTGGCGGLGKLIIKGNNTLRGVTNFGLSAVGHGCSSLKTLSLWNVSAVGDEGLSGIAKGCHMLEKLDLCQTSSISNKGLIAIAEGCPNLTTFSIESCSKIGNEGLEAIARNCPKLESISIKDCPLVGDAGVTCLLKLASGLSRLNLQALNITDFSLAVIGLRGAAITNLVLSGLKHVNERGFWAMGVGQSLQKLVSLTVTSCRGVTDVSIEAMGKCSNLKHMCVRRCSSVSDRGLVAFAKAARSLKSLQLEECHRFTQSGIIDALSNMTAKLTSLTLVKCKGITDIDVEVSMLSPLESLRSLTIQDCPGFGSGSLALIGRLCPQLKHLNLSGLYGITDAGIFPLLENNEAGLLKVNLTGCWNLTDITVSALVRLHGGTLELLNLDGCWRVGDASLAAIAEDCLRLNDLDVSKCAITDDGLAVLSGAKQLSLQVLSLSGCPRVSSRSVYSLTKLGKNLLGLNLQDCNSIGSSTIDLLVEKLWRCDILT